MNAQRIALFCVISIVFCSGCNRGFDSKWEQFRGENSSGIAPPDATPPLELDLEKNLGWKADLLPGLSSPAITKDRIFLTGYKDSDSSFSIYCIDSRDGTTIWERVVVADTIETMHPQGNPACASPATDGDLVYTYFGSYGALCYDLDGNLIWERRLPLLNSQYGTSGSPIIADSLLIISRTDFDKPSLLALNRYNGKTVWQQYMDLAPRIPSPVTLSHATPLIWRDQVILHRAFEIVSFSLKDGAIKWTVGIVSTGVGTPVIGDNVLFVNGWYNFGSTRHYDPLPSFADMITTNDVNKNELIDLPDEIPANMACFKRPESQLPLAIDTLNPTRLWAIRFDADKNNLLTEEEWNGMEEEQKKYVMAHGVFAIDLVPESDPERPVILWEENEYVSEVPSLLNIGSDIYMVMDGGNFFRLEASTGNVLLQDRLGASGAYISSPLYANGHIYCASYNGRITVVKPGDTLNVISRCNLNDKIGASPVAIGNTLYIRAESGLYAFR
ncbi:MAG: PQQ-binding-like beta-propeller repeat protein [Bacteroidales bacterium]|jgi:outer membrane protein assembly factor BamB|nr:PQQ-binding-like beta-propeller repeat protein [Bacteroidales bacterium]